MLKGGGYHGRSKSRNTRLVLQRLLVRQLLWPWADSSWYPCSWWGFQWVNLKMIKEITAVSIPVMAKVRIRHCWGSDFRGADIDYTDESEVSSPADDRFHVDTANSKFLLSVELRIWEKPWCRIAGRSFYDSYKKESQRCDIVRCSSDVWWIRIRHQNHVRTNPMLLPRTRSPCRTSSICPWTWEYSCKLCQAGGVATPADAGCRWCN